MFLWSEGRNPFFRLWGLHELAWSWLKTSYCGNWNQSIEVVLSIQFYRKTKTQNGERGTKVGMREIRLEKVVINIGVGESGEKLAKAERVLEVITGQKPTRTLARRGIREWGVKRGEPIGCKATVRGESALRLLERLLSAVDRRLSPGCFDDYGNFAFGIKEHIDIPGISYDPEIGIFGMDVCVSLCRPGYRIKWRRRMTRPIPRSHRITKDEAISFVAEKFGVRVREA